MSFDDVTFQPPEVVFISYFLAFVWPRPWNAHILEVLLGVNNRLLPVKFFCCIFPPFCVC